MKSYDLDEIKVRLPEYLRALGIEVFMKGDDKLTTACPIHQGTKRNFHAERKPDGIWVWICRSGCGGRGGTALDLHAALHGLNATSIETIAGTAQVLNLAPCDQPSSSRQSLAIRQARRRETAKQIIADQRQAKLTGNLIAKREDLLAPYLSHDWRADYFHESPLDLSPSHDGQAREMLRFLFSPDALIWMGEVKESGKAHHGQNFRTASAWLKTPEIPPRLSCGTYREGSFSRSQSNLVREPFLIIESDDLIGRKPETDADREENRRSNAALMSFLRAEFDLELRALIDTGGKSLHGWFTHPGDQVKAALAKLLDGLAIDSAVFHRASCAPLRAPGCVHQDTGNRASLYYLKPTF